ncbi:MAG: zinc metalloprotease HtpX [Nitrospiraceae bacterium]|nr:zinc metalloprotease HtpX [Nitrospiraceae bacterium]
MPLTFIDIERQKSWRISLLFLFLTALYFIFAFIVAQMVVCFIPGFSVVHGSLLVVKDLRYLAVIGFSALCIASAHFVASGLIAVRQVVEQIGAKDPDPEDGIHRQLMNINEEIQIASGRAKRIRCMVIPTLSANALAVADLRGGAVIAITEGLLSRLTRPQIEAVMAHEAYHVLSGDCLETSLATSFFGMYASALDGLRAGLAEEPRALPVAAVFWLLVKFETVVTMFISREREYRADAGAVRITRNPLALAEALDIIAKRWSGTGLISDGLEMLCISSPRISDHDEAEGWWDDLMSTHPPIRRRIGLLLGMAHVSASVLAKKEMPKPPAQAERQESLLYALDPDNVWLGPFSIAELATFPWFSPKTWISREAGGKAERAADLPALNGAFASSSPGTAAEQSEMSCPACRRPLAKLPYEKTTIHRCMFCGGTLVDNDKLQRMLARNDGECSERALSLVRAVIADNQRSLAIRNLRQLDRRKEQPVQCPKCGRPMFRTFYSYAYLLEIDKCGICGVTWFDPEELEMLRCIIENRVTGAGSLSTDTTA